MKKKNKKRCFPVPLCSNGSGITGWLLFKEGGNGGYHHNHNSGSRRIDRKSRG